MILIRSDSQYYVTPSEMATSLGLPVTALSVTTTFHINADNPQHVVDYEVIEDLGEQSLWSWANERDYDTIEDIDD